jgi:fatty acid desaturase
VGGLHHRLRASRRSEVNAAAGFLVRLFMIQHDCGHGSFFRHRLANDWVGRVNDWVGRVIGVLTLMLPYDRNPLQ